MLPKLERLDDLRFALKAQLFPLLSILTHFLALRAVESGF